jgi:hypothetical protein
MTKRHLLDSFSIRIARARKKSEKNRLLRLFGGRGAAALALGAVLSVGGVTDTPCASSARTMGMPRSWRN